MTRKGRGKPRRVVIGAPAPEDEGERLPGGRHPPEGDRVQGADQGGPMDVNRIRECALPCLGCRTAPLMSRAGDRSKPEGESHPL